MATVATGMPRGIWTIEYKLSTPDRELLFTGTPITGKGVSAATIPGKCAAPGGDRQAEKIGRFIHLSRHRNINQLSARVSISKFVHFTHLRLLQ